MRWISLLLCATTSEESLSKEDTQWQTNYVKLYIIRLMESAMLCEEDKEPQIFSGSLPSCLYIIKYCFLTNP